ncbi:MAG: acyl-CoA thioesterase [Ignavibacteriaceae bacterium]
MYLYEKTINFYDCDPAGILFYARIYELTHAAYEGLIDSFNLGEDYWANDDYVVPILHSEARYHKPITYGQTISVEVGVTKIKTSSFELQYKCKNENGDVCVDVKTVHVLIDKIDWKKKSLTDGIKTGLMKNISVK